MLSREVAGGVPDGGKLASHGECLSVFVESVGCVSRHSCGNAVLGSCWWCHTEMLSREVAGGVPDGGKLASHGECLSVFVESVGCVSRHSCGNAVLGSCWWCHTEMLSREVAGGVPDGGKLASHGECLSVFVESVGCVSRHSCGNAVLGSCCGGVIRKCCLGRLLAVYLSVASWRLMGSVCLCLSSLSAVCPDTHAEMLSWEVAGGVIRKCCLGRLLAVHLTVASWRVMGSVCLCLSQ